MSCGIKRGQERDFYRKIDNIMQNRLSSTGVADYGGTVVWSEDTCFVSCIKRAMLVYEIRFANSR